MTTTLLPTDANDQTIPALRLNPGKAHTIAVTATSARNTTAFDTDTRVVSLYATANVFVRFGNSSVTAATTDHFFPAGVYYDFAIAGKDEPGYTHIAAIRAATDCTLYISEKN